MSLSRSSEDPERTVFYVYCPECGLGPQATSVQRVRGRREDWPESTADSVFLVGTFECKSCGDRCPVEIPE